MESAKCSWRSTYLNFLPFYECENKNRPPCYPGVWGSQPWTQPLFVVSLPLLCRSPKIPFPFALTVPSSWYAYFLLFCLIEIIF